MNSAGQGSRPNVFIGDRGNALHVKSGGSIDIDSGGVILAEYAVYSEILDISSAGSNWVVAPWAGTIETWYSVIDGAIITADAALTLEIGGTLVTGSGITVANSGSAAGDVDSASPSAANAVTAGQAIEIITDGASGNAVRAGITIIIKRTA